MHVLHMKLILVNIHPEISQKLMLKIFLILIYYWADFLAKRFLL